MTHPFNDILPVCCGKRMQLRCQTSKAIELWCQDCEDIVLIKIETRAVTITNSKSVKPFISPVILLRNLVSDLQRIGLGKFPLPRKVRKVLYLCVRIFFFSIKLV